MSTPDHSAAPQALGYLYQSQWPLVEMVRRAPERPDLELNVEMYDDVSWEQQGTPLELLQLKHHVNGNRGLGDKSVDLWRTLAVWMDAHAPGDVDGPVLTMVTTEIATDGTACAVLRPSSYDPVEAKRLLEVAAADSTMASTSASREKFLELTDGERSIFVERIRVLDGAIGIGGLEAELRSLLHHALPHGHEQTFIDRLWAWWQRIVVGLLQRGRGTVSTLEVSQKISDLRDEFAADNLPTLVDLHDFDASTHDAYSSRQFVEQLRWISFSSVLLQKAIVDYYRAYTQSGRWIEDHLVGLDELDAYEEKLTDEWERAFEFTRLRLGANATEEQLTLEGQALFRQVTEQCQVRVRDKYSEAFFTRGKYHELADDGRVGWHRDFEQKLEALLLGQVS